MKIQLFIGAILCFNLLSCIHGEWLFKESFNGNESRLTLVDYKRETYKISLGESYKISDKIIDWHWAALNDRDDKIDSSGIDNFLYLGEPLLEYNSGEWLPALHIETDRNIITKFTCSVLFDMEDNENAGREFLKLISKDIKRLQADSVKSELIAKGTYKIFNEHITETYILTKGKKLEYDKFEYEMKFNE